VKEPTGKERLTWSSAVIVLGPMLYVLVIDSTRTAMAM
jgi:hypothetical protein